MLAEIRELFQSNRAMLLPVICLQVYLVFKEEVLVLSPDMLEGIPVLCAAFSFTTDDSPVLELGDVREYQKEGLVLLKKLVMFTLDQDHFLIPEKHLEMLGLVRLADYLGVDDFLKAAARWLGVSVTAITNSNSIRNV